MRGVELLTFPVHMVNFLLSSACQNTVVLLFLLQSMDTCIYIGHRNHKNMNHISQLSKYIFLSVIYMPNYVC